MSLEDAVLICSDCKSPLLRCGQMHSCLEPTCPMFAKNQGPETHADTIPCPPPTDCDED